MRSSRPYVQLDPAVIEQARQMDLLSYLRAYEPNNLVRVGGSVYCTREHDSLKISNGKWFWWSRGIGGVSALDYLIKVKDYGFVEAVEALTGGAVEWTPPHTPKKDEPKVLLLPPKNKDCSRVMQYLFGRGIDYQLIQECIADGTIYESADYHNAVFVGKDKSGTPKYAALRSTLGSPFTRNIEFDARYNTILRCLFDKTCSVGFGIKFEIEIYRVGSSRNHCLLAYAAPDKHLVAIQINGFLCGYRNWRDNHFVACKGVLISASGYLNAACRKA